jgi:hypothetical protein
LTVLRHMLHVTSQTPRSAFVVALFLAAWPAFASAAPPSDRPVRSTDAALLALVAEAADRSPTFAGLVAAIQQSHGIVYVEAGSCAFGHLNGCLLPYVAPSGGNRYLRVVVTMDRHRVGRDQQLALIAHELRHALEVLEHDDVVDVRTMQRMYDRIGEPIAGSQARETAEARAAGDAVMAELLASAAASARELRPR